MNWISENRYLSDDEMKNNALIITSYLTARGWTLNAIAGMLGNMQTESTINPGIWQSLDEGNTSMGYGLVQWTPATNYTDWATANNYDIDNGNAQLLWIDTMTIPTGQWIPTSSYNFSWNEFKTSKSSPMTLASAFLKNFERAGVEKESARRKQANEWYEYISNNSFTFTPRLTEDGIEGSFYYYDENPFYQSGYGLPNCTCYAWGRFWEISDTTGDGSNKPTLPLGDAGTWLDTVTGYQTGQTPQVGAVIVWKKEGAAGHVAVVEAIDENGNITTSNSAYNSTFFYIKSVNKSDGYNFGNYVFQGFIYNPYAGSTEIKPSNPTGKYTTKKRNRYKFVLFAD